MRFRKDILNLKWIIKVVLNLIETLVINKSNLRRKKRKRDKQTQF